MASLPEEKSMPFSTGDAGSKRLQGSAGRRQQIEAERTRLLYSQAPTGFVVTLLNAVIVTVILRHEIPHAILFTWFGLMVAVTVARFLLVQWYHRTASTADQSRLWQTRFILGASCAGLVWGAAGIFLFPRSSLLHQLFLAFVLGGMITGAVAMLSWVKGAFLAFLVPTALPITMRFLMQGNEMFVAMGVMCVIFSGALLAIARRHQASVADSLALRFENLDLIQHLSASEHLANASSAALQEEVVMRRRVEEALRQARDNLERLVEERTLALARANEALREGETRYRTLVENMDDLLCELDQEARYVYLSPHYQEVLGYEPGELLGRNAFELIHPDDLPAVRTEFHTPGTHGQVSFRARHKSGDWRWFESTGRVYRTAQGKWRGVIVSRNITTRRQLETEVLQAKDAAEAANRVKSEFLATVSHELRTPLNVILGYTEILLEGGVGQVTAQQHHILDRIDKNAHELLTLISMVLDLQRLEVGRLPVEEAVVQVPELLHEVTAETQGLCDQSGLDFRWQAEAQLPALCTDAGKLKVILKNLLGNAIKFTPRGAVIIAAQCYEGGVELRVSDTGIGIPPDALPHIFEAFHQVEGARQHPAGGVGLGLHITKRLVELLGGSITVESKVGNGSTFRVWMPIRRSPGTL
jgi:PAS domain S-box-containing protein